MTASRTSEEPALRVLSIARVLCGVVALSLFANVFASAFVEWVNVYTAPTGSSLHRLGVLDIVLGALVVPTVAAIATLVIWLALRLAAPTVTKPERRIGLVLGVIPLLVAAASIGSTLWFLFR